MNRVEHLKQQEKEYNQKYKKLTKSLEFFQEKLDNDSLAPAVELKLQEQIKKHEQEREKISTELVKLEGIIEYLSSESSERKPHPAQQTTQNHQVKTERKKIQAVSRIFRIALASLFIASIVFLFAKTEEIKCRYLIRFTRVCRNPDPNTEYKFKIDFPSDWQRENLEEKFFENIIPIISFSPKYNENIKVKIMVHRDVQENTLESYLLEHKLSLHFSNNKYQEKTSSKLLNIERSKLGGFDSFQVLMETQESKEKKLNAQKIKFFFTLKDGSAYIIIYESDVETYESLRSIVEDVMIKSFAFE